MTNEQMSDSLKKNWLKNLNPIFKYVLYTFFILKNERFAHFLFFNEQCERIAQVAHKKLAMWANRSGRSPKMSDHEWFAQVAHQKWATMSESLRSLIFSQKTSYSLRTPMSEFPALIISVIKFHFWYIYFKEKTQQLIRQGNYFSTDNF